MSRSRWPACVNEIGRQLQARLEETRGKLTFPEDLPTVSGDRTLLGQIFTNLIENALKYYKVGVPPEVSLTYYVEEQPCGRQGER